MDRKTIVITGSTRGIGYGLARKFLERGHQVLLNGRNEETVNRAVDELMKMGRGITGVAGDIKDQNTFRELTDQAMSYFGKIDIWINNAGLPQTQAYFFELSREEIECLISVNLSATMLGTWSAIHFFKDQGYGKVFNMEGFGSDGRMMDKLSLYGTSKRAVQYFSKAVSREVKEEKIQVGILSPGMVRTDFLNQAMTGVNETEKERNRKVFDILAEDVNVVADFLVSKMLVSTKKYDRIEFLTKRRLLPKLLKLMFLKHKTE
jgi:short-subunit dehydrogenase